VKNVKVYTKEDLSGFIRKRESEEKLGEFVQYSENDDWEKSLGLSDAKFVFLGIPEDIGVRANLGRAGASSALRPALDSFLNQQNNLFLDGSSIFVLGEIEVSDLMKESLEYDAKDPGDLEKLRKLVARLDERVKDTIKTIVALKKTPLIVGGGHNNAFGNIAGASIATGEKISVINCDPHLDFRPIEGRHSGNGFSYAYENKFIQRYAVLGIHEQYNNKASLDKFKEQPQDLFYNTYESIFIREQVDFRSALKQCISFVKDRLCGVELDLDAITNVPSSAKTSSGISPRLARQYVFQCARDLEVLYLHIAEGAPVLSHIKADNKTGKLIAYLLSDFIKGFH
jgi:formiminoglutamase